MQNKIVYCLAFIGLASPSSFAQTKKENKKSPAAENEYQQLLKPLDIYAPPPEVKKLIDLKELYRLVQTQGVTVKLAEEELNAARQTFRESDNSYQPTLVFGANTKQSWSKTRSDSDSTDDYTDRDAVTSSRTVGHDGNFSLSGAILSGIDYSISTPNYSTSARYPDQSTENPRRPHSSSISASLGVELLRNSPIFNWSPNRRKQTLGWQGARTKFKASVLKGILEAQKTYFALIQQHLQLSVQRRGLLLTKALEKDVRAKIQAGEASELEAVRASLATSQAEIDLSTSEIAFANAVQEFRASLSLDAQDEDANFFPDPKALDFDVKKYKLPTEESLNDLVKSNFDIQAARFNLRSTEMDVDIARTAKLPSLKFTSSLNNGGPEESFWKSVSTTTKPNDQTFGVGLSFSYTLYNDKSSDAFKSALVTKQKQSYALEQAIQNAKKTFLSLVKKLEIGLRRYEITKINLKIAEEKLKAEYEKFKFGESGVKNVIDSQTEVNTSRISEISSRIELQTGFIELDILLGRVPNGINLVHSSLASGERGG